MTCYNAVLDVEWIFYRLVHLAIADIFHEKFLVINVEWNL